MNTTVMENILNIPTLPTFVEIYRQ